MSDLSELTLQPRRFRWFNVTLLAIMLASMAALLFIVYQTVESERREREQVALTNEILLELRDVERAALNAETGQRGYLITLDRRYLEAYQQGREQITPSLRRLHELVEPQMSERQDQLIAQIETLAEERFAELDASVDLLEQGRLIDARRAILTDEGQETMEGLRRAIREMEQIEFAILAEASTETARAEARVLPLLGGLTMLLILATLSAIRLVGRTARAEAEAAQALALGEARDRADLLARELNHRVKNLFAVILAIVQLSARDKPDAKPITDGIADRIRALLTAHNVSQGELDRQVASLGSLVEATLAPYRSRTLVAEIEGEEILLPARQATPLGLVLHELTTNAVKYGAWSREGLIKVRWERIGDRVRIVWRELAANAVEQPSNAGFGTMLMESAARQLSGEITREYHDDGLEVRIDVPASE